MLDEGQLANEREVIRRQARQRRAMGAEKPTSFNTAAPKSELGEAFGCTCHQACVTEGVAASILRKAYQKIQVETSQVLRVDKT